MLLQVTLIIEDEALGRNYIFNLQPMELHWTNGRLLSTRD
jgi:hypothetical protein